MTPLPIPYSLRMDDAVALVLLGCFLLSAHILSRSRKFLLQLVRDFLLNRERASIFSTSTSADMRYLLLLIGQSCVLTGVYVFYCCNGFCPELVEHVPSVVLLGVYVGCILLYLCFKWVAYSLLGWVFYEKGKMGLWFESYSTLLYYWGFLLFPFLLAAVYLDVNLPMVIGGGFVLFITFKFLIFYKWVGLFGANLHGCFLLILYFCALEIIPFLILCRGVNQLNDCLIINF